MTAEPSSFALFWAGVIAVSIVVYVILDGFDLGVGILFGTAKDAKLKGELMDSIAPFWDGNETWLVVVGASLFAAFPAVYAIFLPAFYLPVLLLLFGLIFRGVAFEFRGRGGPDWLWNGGFALGSTVVAFVQGAAVGAMMRGIPVTDFQYSGSAFEWLRPLPVVCGLGLVIGYALLGASWIVLKCDDDARDWAYRRIPWLVLGTAIVLAIAAWGALSRLEIARVAYHDRPWIILFVVTGALALIGIVVGARLRQDGLPFAMTVVLFLSSFVILAGLFWPYMIPYQVTIANAAAPDASLTFLFWGAGLFALPAVAFYTGLIYWLFRGKSKVGYH